ncbi:MAG: ankyrin repeat domain-containing protein [Pseudomonadota bacterium]
MTSNHWFTDDDFHRDLAMQAATDNDAALLKDLLAKFPVTKGDDTWLGYMMEDYMGALQPECARLLVEAGLNLNISDHGFLPLHVAIDRGGKLACQLVKVLLGGGADPNLHGFNDWTALHRAVRCQPDNHDLLAVLLDGGANPNIRTRIDHYETPIEAARRSGNPDAAKFIETRWTPSPRPRKPARRR